MPKQEDTPKVTEILEKALGKDKFKAFQESSPEVRLGVLGYLIDGRQALNRHGYDTKKSIESLIEGVRQVDQSDTQKLHTLRNEHVKLETQLEAAETEELEAAETEETKKYSDTNLTSQLQTILGPELYSKFQQSDKQVQEEVIRHLMGETVQPSVDAVEFFDHFKDHPNQRLLADLKNMIQMEMVNATMGLPQKADVMQAAMDHLKESMLKAINNTNPTPQPPKPLEPAASDPVKKSLTEPVDLLAELDETRRKKIFAAALKATAEKMNAADFKISFTNFTVDNPKIQTITGKVETPGADSKNPFSKEFEVTRTTLPDGGVKLECKADLSLEKQFAILANVAYQTSMAAAKEKGVSPPTSVKIAVDNPSKLPVGEDGLTNDERVAVKACLDAGFTHVQCGKDNKVFTKADFAPQKAHGASPSWKSQASLSQPGNVTASNLMQLARAIETATDETREAAIKQFDNALRHFVIIHHGNGAGAAREMEHMGDGSSSFKAVSEAVIKAEKAMDDMMRAGSEGDPQKVQDATTEAIGEAVEALQQTSKSATHLPPASP